MITVAEISRYWAKVHVRGPHECWPWNASLNRYGYGQFRYEGTVNTSHRFAWKVSVGPIPSGMEVDHTCCNTWCQNPGHMELVTKSVNVGRGNRTRRRAAAAA